MQLSVIGIGARNAGDDAIGLLLVESLERRPARAGLSFHLWGDADALTLAHDLMELSTPALIVDCADMGLDPGSHRCFDGRRGALTVRSSSLSTHGLGMAEALALAEDLGFDQEVVIFGVQPFDLSLAAGLSPSMEVRIPGLFEALDAKITEMIAS